MRKALVTVLCLLACSAVGAKTVIKTLQARKAGYYEATTRFPQFAERTPLTQLANRTLRDWATRTQNDFLDGTQTAQKQLGKPISPYQRLVNTKVTCYYAPRLISVQFDTLEFMGGAHPNSDYVVFNFGMINGKPKRLKLDDFFRGGAEHRRVVSDLVINKLRDNPAAASVQSGEVTALNTEQLDRFSIVPDGLIFLLNHYEVGPYSSGRFQVKLTLDELGPDFKKALLIAR